MMNTNMKYSLIKNHGEKNNKVTQPQFWVLDMSITWPIRHVVNYIRLRLRTPVGYSKYLLMATAFTMHYYALLLSQCITNLTNPTKTLKHWTLRTLMDYYYSGESLGRVLPTIHNFIHSVRTSRNGPLRLAIYSRTDIRDYPYFVDIFLFHTTIFSDF